MIEINNQEEMEKYFNKDLYRYFFKDSLILNCYVFVTGSITAKRGITARSSIKSEGNITAGGSITTGEDITAGGNIKSGGNITAVWSIKAEGSIKSRIDIKSGGDITAGGSVKAGGYITAGGYIEAGGDITADDYIYSFVFDIDCKWISTKKLPFYRKFWAEMPPLKNYKEAILDGSKCWEDYKVSKKEAIEICKWDGWHWILRAQLEMFFGLKDRYVLSEGGIKNYL